MSKNVDETEGPQMTSQHGAYALRARLARLYARMRMHTSTRPGNYVHARTHARTRKHAHTDQYVILIAFPLQQWFRERASVLRYTYVACLVLVFLLLISNRHAFKLTLHFREADKFCWRENRAVECLRNHWWFVFREQVQEGGRRVRRTSSW